MSKSHKPVRLVIYAKAPLPGLAKTRLIAALGAEGAARLAEKMLYFSLEQCLQAQVGQIELCVTPDRSAADFWREFDLPANVHMSDQGEGDLGERLWRASARTIDNGEAVLLLGTDCPQLTAQHLRAVARELQHCDAVVMPAHDGGYVLLGLNRVSKALFEKIDWSTSAVVGQTRARLKQCGLHWVELETLRDIDEPGDLQYLPEGWLEIL